MQAAVPVGQGRDGGPAGVGKEVAEKLAADAAQGEVCQLANDNEPTQAVISGAKTAIDRAGASSPRATACAASCRSTSARRSIVR
jgi:[acyl-carrier-protein] S-malonyltransferase